LEVLISESNLKIKGQSQIIDQGQDQTYEFKKQIETEIYTRHDLQLKLEEAEREKQECLLRNEEQQNDITKLREYIKHRSSEDQEQKMKDRLKLELEKNDLENKLTESEKKVNQLNKTVTLLLTKIPKEE